jgi:PIN domain nuclease of toxin-antitoxin system
LIIVDTHVVIWLTQFPEKLSAKARAAVVAARLMGEMAIADITLREIAFLVTSGKISISKPLSEYLEAVERKFRVIPVSGSIAERSMRFGRDYPRDSADQLIGATAIVLGAQLVTKDGKIRESGEVDCVW